QHTEGARAFGVFHADSAPKLRARRIASGGEKQIRRAFVGLSKELAAFGNLLLDVLDYSIDLLGFVGGEQKSASALDDQLGVASKSKRTAEVDVVAETSADQQQQQRQDRDRQTIPPHAAQTIDDNRTGGLRQTYYEQSYKRHRGHRLLPGKARKRLHEGRG